MEYNTFGTANTKCPKPIYPFCIFLNKMNKIKLITTPKVGGILSVVLLIGYIKSTAHPIKLSIPNQISSYGINTTVIIEITKPHMLKNIPLCKLLLIPHVQTNPDINKRPTNYLLPNVYWHTIVP